MIYKIKDPKTGDEIEINWFQYIAYRKQIPFAIALKITNAIKLYALMLGVPAEMAQFFETTCQLDSLEKGVSVSLALKITNTAALNALMLGVPAEMAQFFETEVQIKALQLGVIPELALQFKNYQQISVASILKSERIIDYRIEQILQFENSYQVDALRIENTTVAQALLITNPQQLEELRARAIIITREEEAQAAIAHDDFLRQAAAEAPDHADICAGEVAVHNPENA